MKRLWSFLGVFAIVGGALVGMQAIRQWVARRRMRSVLSPLPTPPEPVGIPPHKTTTQHDPHRPTENLTADAPPPPPDAPPLLLFTTTDSQPRRAQEHRFWLTLQHETFRHRAEGFRPDWAIPVFASTHQLGAPLAPPARIAIDGEQYSYQPFANDTLFHRIPRWSDIQCLSDLIGRTIPKDGIGRQLLEASFRASGSMLRPDSAWHHFAIQNQLGPALSAPYRITIEHQEYHLQIFANDTLYSPVGGDSAPRRLSTTPSSHVSQALWRETYKICGSTTPLTSPLHQAAVAHRLGTPLSGAYALDFEGHPFIIQVFAQDTVIADPQQHVYMLRHLTPPEHFHLSAIPANTATTDDALSSKRPQIGMFPIAGRPRVSQFYGATHWAAAHGRSFFQQTQGCHPGIDFSAPPGTPLLSVGYGLVVWVGRDSPLGIAEPTIIIRYGSLYALYVHVGHHAVRRGDVVIPGQLLGTSGTFGQPHLHFEIREVPPHVLHNLQVDQPPVFGGRAINPIDVCTPELITAFESALALLGGDAHFRRGSLVDQSPISFGAAHGTQARTATE